LLGGRRPIDVIDDGDMATVTKAAQAFMDGVYV
jgi:hypothetical protein